jgi:hypothetical protein
LAPAKNSATAMKKVRLRLSFGKKGNFVYFSLADFGRVFLVSY